MSTDSQDQILEATMTIMVREGVRGTSMRSVAKEADVSLGLISYHFDDKQSLIEATFRRASQDVLAVSRELASSAADPEAQLRAYIGASFSADFLRSDYLTLRVSLWAVARTDPDIARVEKDLYQRYRAELTSYIAAARPTLSHDTAANRATDIVVLQNGLWLNWARYNDRTDLDRGLARCVAIALEQDA